MNGEINDVPVTNEGVKAAETTETLNIVKPNEMTAEEKAARRDLLQRSISRLKGMSDAGDAAAQTPGDEAAK